MDDTAISKIESRRSYWLVALRPLWKVIGLFLAAFGLVTTVREFSQPPEQRWDAYSFVPNWPVSWWLVLSLAVLLISVREGGYRIDKVRRARLGELEGLPSEKYRRLTKFLPELLSLANYDLNEDPPSAFTERKESLWMELRERLFPLLYDDEKTKLLQTYDEHVGHQNHPPYAQERIRALKLEIEDMAAKARPLNPPASRDEVP